MARPTLAYALAQNEVLANRVAILEERDAAREQRLAHLEQQLASLQLAEKPQPAITDDLSALPLEELEKMDLRKHPAVLSVKNWGMEYVLFRESTGRAPFANGVRAWIVGNRPRTKIAA